MPVQVRYSEMQGKTLALLTFWWVEMTPNLAEKPGILGLSRRDDGWRSAPGLPRGGRGRSSRRPPGPPATQTCSSGLGFQGFLS